MLHQVFRLLQYRNQQLPEVIWKERFRMLKHHQLFHLLHRLLHHIQIMLTLLRKLKKQDQLQHRRSFHHVFLLHEGITYPRVFPFQLRISEAFRFRSVYQFQYGCKPVHTADHKDRLLRNNQLMDCFHGLFQQHL